MGIFIAIAPTNLNCKSSPFRALSHGISFESCLQVRGSELGSKHVNWPYNANGLRSKPSPTSTPGWRKVSAVFQSRSWNLSSLAEDEKVVSENGDAPLLESWDRAGENREADEQRERARREEQFQSLLQVPREERDKAQRMQVIDRAAAALAAVNALMLDFPSTGGDSFKDNSASSSAASLDTPRESPGRDGKMSSQFSSQTQENSPVDSDPIPAARLGSRPAPGPDFWSWAPPPRADENGGLQPLKSSIPNPKPASHVMEKEKSSDTLPLPFEADQAEKMDTLPSVFQSRATPSLPPLQSFLEIGVDGRMEPTSPFLEMPMESEAASGVNEELRSDRGKGSGQNADGSRWWRESGVEYRENAVICNWTVIRGVSADEGTEWEEKFWEASNAFEYKELGAEKSGRDASGRVWHEFWKETMWQDYVTGVKHMERSADKWGKDDIGGEWREKWFEHYDDSGYTEKWADKWSQIDHRAWLEPGHAHTWHERWGERFDGHGSAMKYTDKWAERKEMDGRWTKWGDKWDEHFDQNGRGVKQGESWWEGTSGERWNRTWGEGHHGTGCIHKYGKSSSGEHWDTHQQEDTWYERTPHFGFSECFENSRHLRNVQRRIG